MSLLCFLGSNLCRGWDSEALILFIYLVHLSNRPQVSMVYRPRRMLVEHEKNL